jgi:hypothetical protein
MLHITAMFVNGSEQNYQSLERTFHICFLPSFSSFGWGVSEEKMKMWNVNGRQVVAKGHFAFGKVSSKEKYMLCKYCMSTIYEKKVQYVIQYSSPSLIRLKLLQWKIGLIWGVVPLDVVNLVAFYYLSASEILSKKKGDLWWEGPYTRGTTVYAYFSQ